MAKSVHNDVLDGALNIVKNNATLMTICNAEPLTRAEAISNYALADVAMTSTDFMAADGDTNGRKLIVAAKSAVPIDISGNATHVAIVDSTRLLYVTTCTAQQLTLGGTLDIPTWKFEIADPT
jgi:predicted methyltransferase